jgi:hypothetical protein
MSGALLPSLIETFTPHSHRFAVLADTLVNMTAIAGLLGMVIGTLIWFQGLSYIARPNIRRRWGTLPRLSLPPTLDRAARDHISLSTFWCERIGLLPYIGGIYPWLYIAAMPGNIAHPVRTGTAQVHPSITNISYALLAFMPAVIPALVTSRIVEKRIASANLYTELCNFLWPPDSVRPVRQVQFNLPADPLGAQRAELAQIADRLLATAKQLDAHQPRGFSPHPISTLLRGSYRSIHQFLRSRDSLNASVPDSLKEILTLVVMVLSSPHDFSTYNRLDEQVTAFDQHGDPAVELSSKQPSRLAIFAGRAATGIQRANAVTLSLATIAAIMILITLAALGRISIETLVSHLK